MSFGNGASQQPTQTTTQVLSPEQRELMGYALPGIREFAAKVPQRFQGSGVANFDPAQTQGQNMALDAAGAQSRLAQGGAGTSNFWNSDAPWRPENNPALRGAVDAATRPITEAFTQKTLPGIDDAAITSGNFGGSRQGVAQGIASTAYMRQLGDTASQVVNDNYKTNVDAQLKALGLLPQTQAAQLTPALTTSGVGDVRQAREQALLGEQIGNFNYDQYAPYLQSKDIMALLTGLPGGSTVSTANVPQKNPFTSALGGAATGATLGSSFGPWGTAIGGGLGALTAFL